MKQNYFINLFHNSFIHYEIIPILSSDLMWMMSVTGRLVVLIFPGISYEELLYLRLHSNVYNMIAIYERTE